jgi:hypothetical protein
MSQSLRDSLLNKVVESVWISQDGSLLQFVLKDNTKVVWETFGDCCSHTWIENVDNLGFKGAVLSITDDGALENPPPDPTDGEAIAYYGCTVFTEYGRLVIDYRNSSNGYYGGNLEVVTGEVPNTVWKEVE